MDPNRERRVAEWQLWVGWATAASTLVARLWTVVLLLDGGPLDLERFGQAIFKSGLLIAVVLLYRRHAWPAYLMLGVWPYGFVFAWALAHASPPVLAIGLLVGVGSALGARGAHTLRKLRALERAGASVV